MEAQNAISFAHSGSGHPKITADMMFRVLAVAVGLPGARFGVMESVDCSTDAGVVKSAFGLAGAGRSFLAGVSLEEVVACFAVEGASCTCFEAETLVCSEAITVALVSFEPESAAVIFFWATRAVARPGSNSAGGLGTVIIFVFLERKGNGPGFSYALPVEGVRSKENIFLSRRSEKLLGFKGSFCF
jgi:hypothetical protein